MQLTHDGALIVGDAPGGNYEAEARRQALATGGPVGRPPGLYHQVVYHDSWCGIFKGRQCDCKPDIVLCDDATNAKLNAGISVASLPDLREG